MAPWAARLVKDFALSRMGNHILWHLIVLNVSHTVRCSSLWVFLELAFSVLYLKQIEIHRYYNNTMIPQSSSNLIERMQLSLRPPYHGPNVEKLIIDGIIYISNTKSP